MIVEKVGTSTSLSWEDVVLGAILSAKILKLVVNDRVKEHIENHVATFVKSSFYKERYSSYYYCQIQIF